MVSGLYSPLMLRSGGRLRNRIAKAAMEEGGQDPTGRTHPLYALACDQRTHRRALGRYRAWLETRA